MLVRFTKMQALGCDVMLIDLLSQHAHIQPRHIRQWAERHSGVGFQRLLLIEPPQRPEADFQCRSFNAAGQEQEPCIDSLRCLGRFIADKRLSVKRQLLVDGPGRSYALHLHSDGQISLQWPSTAPIEAAGQRIELAALGAQPLRLDSPHGTLTLEWAGPGQPVMISGPAQRIYEGQIRL